MLEGMYLELIPEIENTLLTLSFFQETPNLARICRSHVWCIAAPLGAKVGHGLMRVSTLCWKI